MANRISLEKFSEKPVQEILGDFPSGPLDFYRKSASFDWKKMKILLEGEEKIKFQYWIWHTLASDPLFDKDLETKTLDETRKLTFQRLRRLFQYSFIGPDEAVTQFFKLSAFELAIWAYDEAWMLFDNYRIPRENLLNKSGDVTPDGRYTSTIKDPEKRRSTSLGTLSSGRVGISGQCAFTLKMTISIAIRYSAARKQFGPTNSDKEDAVIEYPLQAELGREFHSLSSGMKPVSGWLVIRAIQECREACGGHGYLQSSRFGQLRNDLDPALTYEGDNNVLIQQTENYLLGRLNEIKRAETFSDGKRVMSPLGSVNFLQDFERIRRRKYENSKPVDAIESYRWLVAYLLEVSSRDIEEQIRRGINSFDAKNNSRVFRCHTLAVAYVEMTVIEWFYKFLSKTNVSNEIRVVLKKLADLYAFWCLEKHLGTLYIGGYCNGPTFGEYIRTEIMSLCRELKSEAVALADVLAVPDEILNSTLGKSDGLIYKNIFGSMTGSRGSGQRPNWWSEVVGMKIDAKL